MLKLGPRQFCQVIILPQGQFRRFLSGTSGEREKILEILFRTTRFKKIQDNLNARATEIEKAFRELDAQMKGLLQGHQGAESVDALEASREAARATALALKAESGALGKERDRLQEALKQAELSQKVFRELAEAETRLADVNARAPAMEALRAELEAAQSAEPLRLPEERLQGARTELAKVKAAFPAAQASLQAAATRRQEAEAKLTAAKGREEERAGLEQRLQTITMLGQELKGVEELRRQAADAKKRQEEVQASGAAFSRDIMNVDLALPELRKAQQLLSQEAGSARALQQSVDKLNGLKADFAARENAMALFAKASQAHEAASSTVKKCAEAAAKCEAEFHAAQDAWVHGQAVILAASLKPGDDCPVCGASEHPRLASGSGQSEGQVKELLARTKAALEKARADLEKARTEQSAREAERQGHDALVRAQDARLQTCGFAAVDALEKELANVATQLKSASQARQKLAEVEAKLEADEKRLKEARQKLVENDEALRQAAEISGKLAGQLSQVEARLANHDVKTVDQARTEYQKVKGALDEMKKALDSAQAARDQALSQELASQESVKGLERQRAQLEASEKELAEAFAAALREQGFEEAAFRAALRPFARQKEIQTSLKAFEEARTSAQTRLTVARDAAAGKTALDPAPLAAQLSEAQTRLSELSRRIGEAEAQAATLERLLKEFSEMGERRKKLHEEFSVFGKMAEVAKGGNEKGMSFQRYVLATFLDEVVETASLRLRQSSKGRYSLKRATSHEDLRKTGGLELVVEDGWHGTVRPVSTLSGGEGFQASLALALGLAEVVQAEAGGVYLDAVFIDEGFGTLDSEALDLAMRTLMDLQKGGRLVGIISHVPELKQIIPARVEIKADRTGSRILSP